MTDGDFDGVPIEEAFKDVHDAIPEEPDFIINQTLPVGLTIMSGPPKVAFKSLQAVLFAANCAQWPVSALPIWMEPLRPGPSLIVSYEASAGVINHILNVDCRIKTYPGSIYVAHKPSEFKLDDVNKANQLIKYMDSKDPAIVVLDPWRNSHSGDENDSTAVTEMLSPLVDWAHDMQASVLLIHHVNKPSDGKDSSSYYAMRGSSALPGLADGLLNIESTKKEGEIYINATFKRGPSWRRLIHLGVPGYGWGNKGYEVLNQSILNIGKLWDEGMKDSASIAMALKKQLGEVEAAIVDLKRNKIIKG